MMSRRQLQEAGVLLGLSYANNVVIIAWILATAIDNH